MSLDFLTHAISTGDRNRNRKKAVRQITWDNLPGYLLENLNKDMKSDKPKMIRKTKFREGSDFPMEARVMYKNHVVPFGIKVVDGEQEFLTAVPCKSVEQGKKQLMSFIEALQDTPDLDTQKVVANWISTRKSITIDKATIPSELLA
jgi:hypothetical protein